jgi:replication factor A1
VIVVIKLEILQTECTLIGSPTIFDANATQPKKIPYSDGVGIHRDWIISRANTNIACSPDQSLLGFSNAAGVVPTQNTIDAKMQQLSLNSYQGQVLSTVGVFNCPGNTYGHPVQHFYQQAPPVYINKGLVANNEAHVIPIAALNPYPGRWTIKVRVAGKTEPWYLGKVKIFSFDLLDAYGGQIRATGLNSAVDKFYDQIVAGNVYLISGGLVKPVPNMSSHLNSDYQIILGPTTSIEIYTGGDSGIPGQKYNFRQISEIENMENDTMVDLLGVVTSVSPSVTTVCNALETHKRTIRLKDEWSGCGNNPLWKLL